MTVSVATARARCKGSLSKGYPEIAEVFQGGTRRSQESFRVISGNFRDSWRCREFFSGLKGVLDSLRGIPRALMGFQGSSSGPHGHSRRYQGVPGLRGV